MSQNASPVCKGIAGLQRHCRFSCGLRVYFGSERTSGEGRRRGGDSHGASLGATKGGNGHVLFKKHAYYLGEMACLYPLPYGTVGYGTRDSFATQLCSAPTLVCSVRYGTVLHGFFLGGGGRIYRQSARLARYHRSPYNLMGTGLYQGCPEVLKKVFSSG